MAYFVILNAKRAAIRALKKEERLGGVRKPEICERERGGEMKRKIMDKLAGVGEAAWNRSGGRFIGSGVLLVIAQSGWCERSM